MVDYNALKKKFPVKNPAKRRRVAAIKEIAREYERKRAELGSGAPLMKKGIVFYGVVVIGLLIVGSLVLSATGRGGRAAIPLKDLQARKSVAALAEALGRYRFHLGAYPTVEEGLVALAAITPAKKGWKGPYVNHIVKDPWGRDYHYEVRGGVPVLLSRGPDGTAGTPDDIRADPALFEAPFRDTTWTNHWMPYQLRGIVLAPDEATKRRIQEEVKHY